jgi:hypothetical protein
MLSSGEMRQFVTKWKLAESSMLDLANLTATQQHAAVLRFWAPPDGGNRVSSFRRLTQLLVEHGVPTGETIWLQGLIARFGMAASRTQLPQEPETSKPASGSARGLLPARVWIPPSIATARRLNATVPWKDMGAK